MTSDADDNPRTIASYERCAADYADATRPKSDEAATEALVNFVGAVSGKGRILEIGSGPGWDADWLESNGLKVRRTDAAAAFVELQRSRGAQAETLDVMRDNLGGPYAGVVALYVFQHIERAELPHVLEKVALALADGGAFLFALREGDGEIVEKGDSGGHYYIALWHQAALLAILEPLGLRHIWSRSNEDADGRWLTILAVKDAE